jgi:signal transduction histidine kinase
MSLAESTPSPSLEEQVALLKQQLAHAQKLTALGELVGTTAHEFNNVLTTVINYAKMGMRHRDAETRDKAFEKILAAGNRAARITTGVLGMAKNRSGNVEPTNLAQLADDTLLLVERELAKHRVAVEKSYQPCPQAMANGNQIQQVLLNLLINARQAMPQGGRVYVRLSADVDQHFVDLSVRDTGTGIAPEVLPRIFDSYFSTKAGPDSTGKGGAGLGLSFCREIIEAHHGRIRVDSTVGRGTCFTLRLPAATPAPAPERGPIPHGAFRGAAGSFPLPTSALTS